MAINLPTKEICPHAPCDAEVPISAVTCVVCGRHISYPNVRLAEGAVESDELDARIASAFAEAEAKGSADRLNEFRAVMSTSKAVLARPAEDLDWVTSKDNRLVSTYYHMTADGGSRTPELNEWDPARDRNDSTINPHYYRDLHYAALSLDGLGVGWYGACHITLRDGAIDSRTTVFEENGFAFNANHPTGAKGLPDPGFRAPWHRRAGLAVAKLGKKIGPKTRSDEFPAILVERDNGTGDTDFIEVHIYGRVHPKAFEQVLAAEPTDDADRAIWHRTKRRLEKLGVKVIPIANA